MKIDKKKGKMGGAGRKEVAEWAAAVAPRT